MTEHAGLTDALRRMLLAASTEAGTPTPWTTPTETGLDASHQPVEHEGCLVWPWRDEADMRLAYWLRNHAEAILATLEATNGGA